MYDEEGDNGDGEGKEEPLFDDDEEDEDDDDERWKKVNIAQYKPREEEEVEKVGRNVASSSTAPPSSLMAEITSEESSGLFRNIRGSFAVEAIAYHTNSVAGHYEHINPALTAPGKRFVVLAGPNMDVPIANGYIKIVTTPHGFFVQVSASQFCVPFRDLISSRGNKMSAIYGWIAFRFAKTDIFFAGSSLPVNSNNAAQAMLPPPAKQMKNLKIRKTPEFPRGFFYIKVNDIMIKEKRNE